MEGAQESASFLTQALAVNKRGEGEGEGWPDPGAEGLPQPLRYSLAVMPAPTVLYMKAHFFLPATTFAFKIRDRYYFNNNKSRIIYIYVSLFVNFLEASLSSTFCCLQGKM